MVGGLRKAYMQDPKQSGLRTGLVWCPRSNSIVLNSTPGVLQFYDPSTDAMIKEVINRPKHAHKLKLILVYMYVYYCDCADGHSLSEHGIET